MPRVPKYKTKSSKPRTKSDRPKKISKPKPQLEVVESRCNTCIYGSSHTGMSTCNYILITGHSRRCEPGDDCTCYVAKSGKGPSLLQQQDLLHGKKRVAIDHVFVVDTHDGHIHELHKKANIYRIGDTVIWNTADNGDIISHKGEVVNYYTSEVLV